MEKAITIGVDLAKPVFQVARRGCAEEVASARSCGRASLPFLRPAAEVRGGDGGVRRRPWLGARDSER